MLVVAMTPMMIALVPGSSPRGTANATTTVMADPAMIRFKRDVSAASRAASQSEMSSGLGALCLARRHGPRRCARWRDGSPSDVARQASCPGAFRRLPTTGDWLDETA